VNSPRTPASTRAGRSGTNAFGRLGAAVARRPWLVVAGWLAAIGLAVPFAPQVPGVLSAGGFSSDELEAAQARNALADELNLPPSALVLVIASDTDAGAGDPAFEAAVAAAIAEVPEAPYVTDIRSHLLFPRQVSVDRRTVYEVVGLDLAPDDSPDALPGVEAALRPQPGIRVLVAGSPAFYGDIQRVSEQDLQRSEIVSLPLAGAALLLVFGSVVAAGVPLVVGGAAVVVALGAIFVLASVTPLSIFVLNLATLLGLGLGVDYSLLLTSRFREELARCKGGRRDDGTVDRDAVQAAVASTTATAGRAVFFSGLTVLLGLAGLLLFEFMILRSVGLAGALVVGIAVASALTLLPAVLTIVGPRVDALALPWHGRRRPDDQRDGAWARLARWVMARPVAVLVPTLALLLVLGAPFLHVRFNAPDASILPPDVPSREAFSILTEEWGEGEFAPLLLAVRTDGPATAPGNVRALYDYSRRLASDARVERVESIVDVDPRLSREQYELLLGAPTGIPDRFLATVVAATTRDDLTVFTLVTPYGPNRSEARSLVADLRDGASALAPPPGIEVLVGGGAAEVADVVDRIAQDFPRTAVFVVVATYLVLFVLLRSLVLPAKALLMNGLSIVASFGALVWIFQDGNLSAILGFQPLGFVETSQPVILFCVLFGLSMDYEVFLLSRMKEAWDRTGDNREAVAQGLERSGRIVTSAAVIVVVVAGSFAFAEVVLIKALGIGVAIAVALDATVVRALLVPATMRLIGDWNWWLPSRLRRFMDARLPLVEGAALVTVLALGLAACSPAGRILAVDPPVLPSPPAATPSAPPVVDPMPVTLPADDAPHDRLTEWWYYTGHLRTQDGRRFGFEFVVFRAERGAFPVSWASHLALTDEDGQRFRYDQRSEIGPQVDRSGAIGFDLAVTGQDEAGRPVGEPWTMRGADGVDVLAGASEPAGFALALSLDDGDRPAVLHDTDGWIDFGVAGSSYYYSRTQVTAVGTVTLDGEQMAVDGTAWFDHQWGDFISVGGGGWDWFAVNLEDGTDVTLSLVRAADGSYPLVYGTLVRPDGGTEHLPRETFTVEVTDEWTSQRTDARYPAGWRITVPDEDLTIDLVPTVPDQELDTRPTTGVVYWEGSQVVEARRGGQARHTWS
jgi:RND superfamily putative drug exporter